MSNTQFAFIDQSDIPTREQLQETINNLGYDLNLNPELSLKDDEGFSPFRLNGEPDVGFELFCEHTSDVVEGDEEFEEMANGKDTCITMSWGGSFKDCCCVLIVSYALMKDFGAITTYEGEELDTLESLKLGIIEALEEVKKEESANTKQSTSKTTYTKLRNYCEKIGFTAALEKLGFNLSPDEFWFYRIRGDYLDIMSFWLSSSKNYVSIPIDCQKAKMITHCNMDEFPKGFTKNYGLKSDCFIDEDELSYASWDWEVETEEEIKETFSEVLKLIKSHAEPWFQNITDDEKMFYSYSLRMQETEFGQKLKNELGIN